MGDNVFSKLIYFKHIDTQENTPYTVYYRAEGRENNPVAIRTADGRTKWKALDRSPLRGDRLKMWLAAYNKAIVLKAQMDSTDSLILKWPDYRNKSEIAFEHVLEGQPLFSNASLLSTLERLVDYGTGHNSPQNV